MQGVQDWEETATIKEVEKVADQMLRRIFSNYSQNIADGMLTAMSQFFRNSYPSIIVNNS